MSSHTLKNTPNGHAGSCTLVGAGPGDPELLTLKAVKAIGRATVLLVDDLVNPAILDHASPDARVVHVGKRGGCKSTPQAFIEKLMVTETLAGEHVVRLKGETHSSSAAVARKSKRCAVPAWKPRWSTASPPGWPA